MKLVQVKNRGAVGGLVGHSVVFPANSRSQGEGWRYLPLVLEVGHVEHTAQPMAAPRRDVVDVRKVRVDHVPFASEGQDVTRGLPLVQPNPTNLHARLE